MQHCLEALLFGRWHGEQRASQPLHIQPVPWGCWKGHSAVRVASDRPLCQHGAGRQIPIDLGGRGGIPLQCAPQQHVPPPGGYIYIFIDTYIKESPSPPCNHIPNLSASPRRLKLERAFKSPSCFYVPLKGYKSCLYIPIKGYKNNLFCSSVSVVNFSPALILLAMLMRRLLPSRALGITPQSSVPCHWVPYSKGRAS